MAFQADSTNVITRCSDGSTQIFVRDRTEERTTCASVDSQGNHGNNESVQPSISADGRFVAFSSGATNLTGNRCTGGNIQVFVRDRADEKTRCASLGLKKAEGNGESSSPSISANGSLVTFESDASNLVKKDTNGLRDVFSYENSTSAAKGSGSSFFFFFDLSQTGGPTGGFFVNFD